MEGEEEEEEKQDEAKIKNRRVEREKGRRGGQEGWRTIKRSSVWEGVACCHRSAFKARQCTTIENTYPKKS